MIRRLTAVWLAVLLLMAVPASAENVVYSGGKTYETDEDEVAPASYDYSAYYGPDAAYILKAPALPDAPALPHEVINILLMGVDYGVMTAGTGKEDIKNCHTDTVIMAALDLTEDTISLISMPRDTMTYVPGVQGIYKLNAAINCGETFSEGIVNAKNTVAWQLGGIRPDHYVIIAPPLVEKIGEKIGGLDMELEMTYVGTSGTRYERGLQHLDGVGIIDYARARTNATRNGDDYGRTSRQRAILNALFRKVSDDPDLVYDILDVLVENFDRYFFSDLSVADLFDMLPLADRLAEGSISDYVMNGELAMSMMYFTSSFFDQPLRQSIIREVYGVEVPAQRLNSHAYFNYLYQGGFSVVKAVRVSEKIIGWVKARGFEGEALREAEAALQNLVDAFSAVDDRLSRDDTMLVEKMTDLLKLAVARLVEQSRYPGKLSWQIVDTDKWYMDPDIERFFQIDWS